MNHIERGNVLYAGVDYGCILEEAEKEADVILWDGGNNDLPFYRPDLMMTIVDPHRPGHELLYHPGEANVRLADVVIVNKVDTAAREDIDTVIKNVRSVIKGRIIKCRSPIAATDPQALRGKRVCCRGRPYSYPRRMSYGAGFISQSCRRHHD